jgi:TctA family transporter
VLYAIVLSVNLAINYTSYANGGNWVFSIGFSLVVTTVGWFGYIVLYYRLFKTRLNWTKYPTGNLLFTVFLSGLYGVIIMVTAMKILHYSEVPITNRFMNTSETARMLRSFL